MGKCCNEKQCLYLHFHTIKIRLLNYKKHTLHKNSDILYFSLTVERSIVSTFEFFSIPLFFSYLDLEPLVSKKSLVSTPFQKVVDAKD